MADNFSKTIEAVDEMFSTGSVYTTWVKFTVGDLVIDTASKDNNYFMSLVNEKTGSGSANKFTVGIVFVPKILDSTGTTDADIIDKKLTMIFQNSGNDSSSILKNNICYITYGYGSNSSSNFRTETYEGIVLDYSVEINDGALVYTITGVSSLVIKNESLYEFPSEETAIKPSDVMKRIVEGEYNGEPYLPGYKFDTTSACDDIEVPITGGIYTIYEYFDLLIKNMRCSTDTTDGTTHVYAWSVNDEKDNKTISISKYPANNTDVKFTFNWMNPRNYGKASGTDLKGKNISGGNLVIDFKTEFKGAVLYGATAKIASDNEDFRKFYGITEEGKIEPSPTQTYPSVTSSGAINRTTKNIESSIWESAIQHSYKATMTLVGIPCEIKIGTAIEIIPLILGSAHHTKGIYMITKVIDRIDSSGFITELSLIKIPQNSN